MLGAIRVKSDSHLSGGNSALVGIIGREIRASGPISFARFMELALYQPEHGYYASGRAQIGRAGDFFSNVSVGSIFGKLLAAQFAEVWEKLGRPRPFTIVEQGAHDGQFAADVLSAWEGAECSDAVNYVIVEPFTAWRERQQEKLANFAEKICWADSMDEVTSFTGIHFSNELFDALPVHLVASRDGDWKELVVASHGDEFTFGERACAPRGGLRPPIPAATNRSYRTEIHLPAAKLMRSIAAKLSRGVILTIDYGFTREEFYSPQRATGTLQVRARHTKLSSPFEQIGLADISAHLDWTSLIEAAESAGAHLLGLTDQHHFLTGILGALTPPVQLGKLSPGDKRGLQTLLHPEMLGRTFQVLALAQNFAGQLSGFRFARQLA